MLKCNRCGMQFEGEMGICLNCGVVDIIEVVSQQEKPEKSILLEAEELVCETRQAKYGDPFTCMERTARIFNALTEMNLKPEHVPIFNIAQKWARELNLFQRDNPRDSVGYTKMYCEYKEYIAKCKTCKNYGRTDLFCEECCIKQSQFKPKEGE